MQKLLLLLLTLAVLVAACTPEAAAILSAELSTDNDAGSVSPFVDTMQIPINDILRNSTYQGIYEEPTELTDGRYEGPPFVEGGASRPTVSFEGDDVGDLNGDGLEDAAVLLTEDSDGSGTFSYLAVLLNQEGELTNSETILIGDRVLLDAVNVEGGRIIVLFRTRRTEDMTTYNQVVRFYHLAEEGLNFEPEHEMVFENVPTVVGPWRDVLRNATYTGIYEYDIKLANGIYIGEPFVPGGASRPTAHFLGDGVTGDLNEDGVEDVVAIVYKDSGGSGTFAYLTVFLDQDGLPINIATEALADWTQGKTSLC